MTFEDFKRAIGELARAFEGHSNCTCARHGRLSYKDSMERTGEAKLAAGFPRCETSAADGETVT